MDKQGVIITIFGAGGDLAWRKLVPALYNLWLDGWLPANFHISSCAASLISP